MNTRFIRLWACFACALSSSVIAAELRTASPAGVVSTPTVDTHDLFSNKFTLLETTAPSLANTSPAPLSLLSNAQPFRTPTLTLAAGTIGTSAAESFGTKFRVAPVVDTEQIRVTESPPSRQQFFYRVWPARISRKF